jgi:Flp pilus assembly protein TadB
MAGEESKLDRELIELLNELRVTLPGVQVLFAFLLMVPFNQGFQRVTELQKNVYFAALIATALGSACLIAPTPYHRIRFRDRDKDAMLRIGNKLAIAGTFFLATGITCAVFFVTDFLFNVGLAFGVAGAVAAVVFGLWYALPLARELQD